MPLNVRGRICLPATLGFGVAGVLIVRFLLPFMRGLHQDAHPIANEAAALILMAVISADLALTVASLTRLLARMEALQHDFNEHMEEGYQIAQAEGPVAATEYAAMTVKSAGSRAAALLTEQLQKRTGHLTGGELYHLHVIRHFKKYERKALALRIREKLAGKRVHAAEMLGVDPGCVFKTLVARGEKTGIHVFCIPVAEELDLKKCAAAIKDKKVEMIHVKELLPLTGYIRGGCSPIGMKKKYPTCVDETCILYDEIYVSAGLRGQQIILNPEDLIAYTEAVTADLLKDG